MTAKKVFRSTAAKLIAFLIVVGCVAGAMARAEFGIMDIRRWSNESEVVYRLEDRFEDSQLMNGMVNSMVADLDYALHEGLSQDSFNRQFNGANFIGDYYGRMGDRVLKNSDITEEDAASSMFLQWPLRMGPCITPELRALCHLPIPMWTRRGGSIARNMHRKTA